MPSFQIRFRLRHHIFAILTRIDWVIHIMFEFEIHQSCHKKQKKLFNGEKLGSEYVSDNSLTIPNRRLGNGAMNVRLMLLLVVWFFILFYKSIDLVRIVCISDDMTATKQNKCQNIFIPFGSLLSLCIIVLRLSSPTKANNQNERKRRKKTTQTTESHIENSFSQTV